MPMPMPMTMASAAASFTRTWRHSSPNATHLLIQQRRYQDVAFMWARKNPEMARACLKVPPPTQLPPNDSIHSLDDYLHYRNWNFDTVQHDKNELTWAQRLVSHVLTAPLTVAHYFPSVITGKQRICVVGARAEATLPVEYWKEALLRRSNKSTQPIEWVLDFCGPQVLMARSNSVTLKHEQDSLSLQWTHAGYLHDMPESDRPQWDGFVLYNPGLGHANLRQGWLPTLDHILSTNKPILLTAHSERDAERDAELLQELTGNTVDYHSNPFASRITYQDPLSQDSHYVSPNSLVARILN